MLHNCSQSESSEQNGQWRICNDEFLQILVLFILVKRHSRCPCGKTMTWILNLYNVQMYLFVWSVKWHQNPGGVLESLNFQMSQWRWDLSNPKSNFFLVAIPVRCRQPHLKSTHTWKRSVGCMFTPAALRGEVRQRVEKVNAASSANTVIIVCHYGAQNKGEPCSSAAVGEQGMYCCLYSHCS